jgi:hypothetical protein
MKNPHPPIFEQNGLDLSLYLTSEDIVLNKHHLPNMPNDRPIVCRLPSIYTEYLPPDEDRKLYPPDSENQMIEPCIEALEERLMQEAEKFLEEPFDYFDFKSKAGGLVFDLKRNLYWGNEHCIEKVQKAMALDNKANDDNAIVNVKSNVSRFA